MFRNARFVSLAVVLAASVAALACGGCAMKEARLLAVLPDFVNTPDGMALMPDSSIVFSAPNFNDPASPAVLMKLSPDNKPALFYKLPVLQETGRIGPMGITRGPSGDLYLCDMQYMFGAGGKNLLGKSRLLRVVIKDGRPAELVTVASGFNVANGVAVQGDGVYVTESVLEEGSNPLTSAVLRFKIGEEGVQLKSPLKDDPHVLATFKSYKRQWLFGADGIAFDSKGNLFVGLFGDGVMHKITFDAGGNVRSNTVFAKAPGLVNCDGMSCDLRTDKLYVADSAANAIQVISPDGSVRTLARNGDVDKAAKLAGKLDQPCEALVRGNTIVVSNMDWPFPGMVNEKHEQPATLSVIDLGGK
jgi:sugar lactone lactonase YvrE